MSESVTRHAEIYLCVLNRFNVAGSGQVSSRYFKNSDASICKANEIFSMVIKLGLRFPRSSNEMYVQSSPANADKASCVRFFSNLRRFRALGNSDVRDMSLTSYFSYENSGCPSSEWV